MKLRINPSKINWKNKDNYFFSPNKKISKDLRQALEKFPQGSHLFILSSGTRGKKGIALSKEAFLASAQAVNHHLKAGLHDRWLISLPLFHVGGLSIPARGFLSGSKVFVFKKKWEPSLFLQKLRKEKITLTSLVPAQVYDLVLNNKKAPPHLRAVLVGGGALSPPLYEKARLLNWPLLPSYGLTEMGSTAAAAPLHSLKKKSYPDLKPLGHCRIQIKKGLMALKSPALLTAWIELKPKKSQWRFVDPQKGILTEDRGRLTKKGLQVWGRSQVVKILGESVSLLELEGVLEDVLMKLKAPMECRLLTAPHPRAGCEIHLISSPRLSLQTLLKIRQSYNKKVRSIEKIRNHYILPLKKTGPLLKISSDSLKKELGF